MSPKVDHGIATIVAAVIITFGGTLVAGYKAQKADLLPRPEPTPAQIAESSQYISLKVELLKRSGEVDRLKEQVSALEAKFAGATQPNPSGSPGSDRETTMARLAANVGKGELPSTPETPSISVESSGVRFQVTQCRGVGQTIRVEMLVTSTDGDVKFVIDRYRSIMYDDSSNEHKIDRVTLANGSAEASNTQVETLLLKNHPAKASMEIRGVSPDASSIGRLVLHCGDRTGYNVGKDFWFMISLSDIPIRR